MSTTDKKSASSTNTVRRPPTVQTPVQPTTPSKSPTRSTTSRNAISRTASQSGRTGGAAPISARAAVKKSTGGSRSTTISQTANDGDANAEDETKAEEAASRVQELEAQLDETESSGKEKDRQIEILQTRLDDALSEQGKLEVAVQQHLDHIEALEKTQKDHTRQLKELESHRDADRGTYTQDKEASQAREEGLNLTIQKLRESLARKEATSKSEDETGSSLSRQASPSPEVGDFAPSSQHTSSSSSGHQKDKIIERLKFELAEVQVKLLEVENLGGGQQQELDAIVMEVKVENAKLKEENEGYQMLLSEKTLSGDMSLSELLRVVSPDGSRPTTTRADAKSTTLADELDDAGETADVNNIQHNDTELAALKDQNKALTLYINNIISRVLQHSEFENVLSRYPDLMSAHEEKPTQITRTGRTADKDLPPPPPPSDKENVGLLGRTRSLLGARRPRPTSMLSAIDSNVGATGNQDPSTAPRIPIGRNQQRSTSGSHHRIGSDMTGPASKASRAASPPGGRLSPPLLSPRSSYSHGGRPPPMPSVPSGSVIPTVGDSDGSGQTLRDGKTNSSRNSVTSDPGTGRSTSPPRSTTSSGEKEKSGQAIMMGSRMRPLRLVQEANEADEAAKKGNRSSWMGWLNKSVGMPDNGR